MTTTAINHDVVAAAAAVQRAATPRRKLTLVDEFGPFRGRPFLADADGASLADFASELADMPATSSRGDLAYEVAY